MQLSTPAWKRAMINHARNHIPLYPHNVFPIVKYKRSQQTGSITVMTELFWICATIVKI
jgi:hypothetical protein